MNALYDFIVKPLGDRYNNKEKIGDKELIVNSQIDSFKFVNKKAVVVATPTAFDTDIKPGDIIYIHHNVFRKWYDQKGKQRNSCLWYEDVVCFKNR